MTAKLVTLKDSSDNTMYPQTLTSAIYTEDNKTLTEFINNVTTTKQDNLVSGTNIKTINNESLLGSENISVQEVLTSGTNIKTINDESILGEGNLEILGGVTSINGSTGDVTITLSSLGIHMSTAEPTSSDGNDGDLWIMYSAD